MPLKCMQRRKQSEINTNTNTSPKTNVSPSSMSIPASTAHEKSMPTSGSGIGNKGSDLISTTNSKYTNEGARRIRPKLSASGPNEASGSHRSYGSSENNINNRAQNNVDRQATEATKKPTVHKKIYVAIDSNSSCNTKGNAAQVSQKASTYSKVPDSANSSKTTGDFPSIQYLNYAYCPPRSNAFVAPLISLPNPRKHSPKQNDALNFEFNPRSDYRTEVTFTVEPRKQPRWKTMLQCGFIPMINCAVPSYCLSPSGKKFGEMCNDSDSYDSETDTSWEDEIVPQEKKSKLDKTTSTSRISSSTKRTSTKAPSTKSTSVTITKKSSTEFTESNALNGSGDGDTNISTPGTSEVKSSSFK